jgi:hypothetical protein
MNEQLIETTTVKPFTGKTYNKHPHWSNQPLRLTEEELNNPLLIFNDFFQTYHLNETREVLWQWLLAVISSDGSISNEPLERSNHIYFYEKLEEVIEAAFTFKINRLKVGQNAISKEDVSSIKPLKQEAIKTFGIAFNKEKRLIEYVNDDPLYVIEVVLDPDRWCFISLSLKEWVEIGLISEDDAYLDSVDRQNLITFRDHLLLLIESLYIINLQKISDTSKKEWIQKIYTPHLLSKEQVANLKQVIAVFFEKYPMLYITRELEDLLTAGICHTGPWRNEIACPWHVFDTYREILCLIKSAEQLLTSDSSTLITSEV